jgi:hypothetical protein
MWRIIMKKTLSTSLTVLFVVILVLSGCQTASQYSGGGRAAIADKVQPKQAFKAKAFDLPDVKLLDGPFKDAMKRDKRYLLEIEPDRLLHTFRLNAGLPSKAKPYGGWELPTSELRGHSIGHYLSACALMYSATGDEELKKRTEYITAELAKCQKALGTTGYLSAYPEEFIDRVIEGKMVWAPWYTLHKIMAGLLDTYTYCGNKQALEVVCGMANWAKMRMDKLSDSQMQDMMRNEFGGMNEVLANLYTATGKTEYLALAQRFDHKMVFGPLAERKDELERLHANTQIPKVIGAAREYEITGQQKYETIATFFWDTVIDNRTYSIGGTSNYEYWRTPPGKLAAELSVESAETCCTYNMLKLTRHLFEWTADVKYADYYERAVLNHILASQSPENGMMMYYVALKPGHFKVFCQPENSFWCCTGTGMENHAKYGDSIYFYDEDGLYVNLFIASELNWKQKGFVIRQETKFPQEDKTSLLIKASRPAEFAIRVRVPYWATKGAKVSINGWALDTKSVPGSYMVLNRTWKDGDRIDIEMPMSLHLQRMPDDVKVATIMYGPVVLAGELGMENLNRTMEYVPGQRSQHNAPSIEVPVLVGDLTNLENWIKPVEGQKLVFQTTGAGKPNDVILSPFYELYNQRYNIYWNLVTEPEYKQKEAKQNAEKASQSAEKKTAEAKAGLMVDEVKIGDAESEKAHNQQGEGTSNGIHRERNWRDASENGWFSYDVKVLPDAKMVLECTWWGGDVGREFTILVNDKQLAAVKIDESHGEVFYTDTFQIPEDLTKGKDKITVKLQSPADSYAGGIFGLVVNKEK